MELNTRETKMEIKKAAKTLKLKDTKVRITDDFPKRIRE